MNKPTPLHLLLTKDKLAKQYRCELKNKNGYVLHATGVLHECNVPIACTCLIISHLTHRWKTKRIDSEIGWQIEHILTTTPPELNTPYPVEDLISLLELLR